MAKNLNPASRILRVLEETTSTTDNTQVLEAWANIFFIKEAQPIKRAVAVTQLLQAMHQELELASNGLAKASFSVSLYESAFSKIENAISPMILPNTWNSARQYLSAEVFTALAFCAEILPDEESQISQEDLIEIQNQVDELRDTLATANLPARLRTLIEHHISLIENALSEYKIVGAKALREAGRAALGEIIEVRAEISESKEEPAIKKLDATWKKVNNVADIALKAEKLAQLGQKAWDAISSIL
jgi:hypothetical protein